MINNNYSKKIDDKVIHLLQDMTFEEKVGQTRSVQIQEGDLLDNGEICTRLLNEVSISCIGAIQLPFKSCTPKESTIYSNQLQKHIINHSRLGIPILVHLLLVVPGILISLNQFIIPLDLENHIDLPTLEKAVNEIDDIKTAVWI